MRIFSRKHGVLAALVASSLLSSWLLLRPREAAATPLPKALQVEQTAVTEELDAGVDENKTTATIVFMTVPYVTSVVTWGKKPLGKILPGKPLVVVRPRDSGPLDVMVRAAGYLPVQTRAHTFADSRVMVKLTPIDKKSELLGYRIPIDAGVGDGAVEGGLEGGWPTSDAQLPVVPPQPVPAPFPPQPVPAPIPPPPAPVY